jgi:hypothetical protein
MKHRLVGVLVGGLAAVWACSDDNTPSTPTNAAADSGATSESVVSDSGGPPGVECTHPGAGKSLGGDRCDCTTARNVAGEWSTKRTCREGDVCPTKNREERVVLTQDGTNVRADRGDSYSVSGKLCGDVLVWSGGPKDGLNPECGQLRFTDDSHYVSDSCFVASGECLRTHGQGCPSQKGQCTGLGAKLPETVADVQKVICN